MAERSAAKRRDDAAGPPDVLLDIPKLRVDSLHLELDDLEAHVALEASVLNLVTLSVGVDARLRDVKLDIKGVDAEVALKARLDQVATIVDRLMTTLDRNPDLIEGLNEAVAEVGEETGEALDRSGDLLEDVGHGAGRTAGVGPDGLTAGAPSALAKAAAKRAAREVGRAAAGEARDLSMSAARKVRQLGERREQRRAPKALATKRAVRLAQELGVDLAELEGSGPDGRIMVKDVRRAKVR
jgi:hypothetical protein